MKQEIIDMYFTDKLCPSQLVLLARFDSLLEILSQRYFMKSLQNKLNGEQNEFKHNA